MSDVFIIFPAVLGALIASGLYLYGVARVLEVPRQLRTSTKCIKKDVLVVAAPKETARVAPASALHQLIAASVRGDVTEDPAELKKMSRDTSIFVRVPELVVYPKDAQDVSALVLAVRKARTQSMLISLTARSAGTDMSGGPLTRSVVAIFTKYFNHIEEVVTDGNGGHAVTEPGVYYRDFEKATLAKGLILPSYPASRELAAMGGLFNNNSGGERTLEFGKTERYVEEADVVLADGSRTTFKDLTESELTEKEKLQTLEGKIYREMKALIKDNASSIEKARPKVSKNSAGYALWNVIDREKGTFNLARLICGAQGTLALTTRMRLRLVKEETHRSMLVIFLPASKKQGESDFALLPEIVKRVLPYNPESFESYDDNTFKLAVRFLPQMLSQMGFVRALRLGFSFLPESFMALTGGIPKLVLMAEFSENTATDALMVAEHAEESLRDLHLSTSIKRNEKESEKYWLVRRESFNLLRKNLHGLYAAAFIDDFVVPVSSYPEFLPELNALLSEYKLLYTIAGHIGNGNFHIIPLMDLNLSETRQTILELAPKVYGLVIKYGGTTTGEHNDGIIRTPYLPLLFGPGMMMLFEKTKRIFDPDNIFNPGKKVGGTFADIKRDMLQSV